MRELRLLFCSICYLSLVFSPALLNAQAGPALRIDEQRMKFRLLPSPRLELPIVNPTDQSIEGDFRLELIDTQGKLKSELKGTFSGAPGTTVQKLDWAPDRLATEFVSTLGWFRLRYIFIPKPELRLEPARGIVQIAQIMTGAFEVRMSASRGALPGQKYPVRVKVDDPSTGKAIGGVLV